MIPVVKYARTDRKVNLVANFAVLVLSFFFLLWAPTFSQDTKLIEAAKKEGGKVVAYGSLQADILEPSKKAFEKKTGLALEYWRASATKVMDRAVNEYRAGKPLFVCFSSRAMRLGFYSGTE